MTQELKCYDDDGDGNGDDDDGDDGDFDNDDEVLHMLDIGHWGSTYGNC